MFKQNTQPQTSGNLFIKALTQGTPENAKTEKILKMAGAAAGAVLAACQSFNAAKELRKVWLMNKQH